MRNIYIFTLLFFSFFIFVNDTQAQSGTTDYEKLVGKWVRPDGGYILVIKNVRFDGSIEAEYLNPNRISISKAHVKTELGKINIFVETLTYDKDTDSLVGVYHHLGINKKFDVHFMRR
jgi:hypothetical protein